LGGDLIREAFGQGQHRRRVGDQSAVSGGSRPLPGRDDRVDAPRNADFESAEATGAQHRATRDGRADTNLQTSRVTSVNCLSASGAPTSGRTGKEARRRPDQRRNGRRCCGGSALSPRRQLGNPT
jgi:hypothetical protein